MSAAPLLFVLTLEPLAIQQSADQLGIPINEQFHLISIYADDILLYLRYITANNSPLPEIFATFEHISGLTIHQNKSFAFIFQDRPDLDAIQFGTYSFPVTHHTFKYLGIQVYRDHTDQIDGNIGCAITSLRTSVTFWPSLPLSIMGRIAISKMVMLPRLYYFINLLVLLPQSIFKTLNTLLVTLIWGTGRRHISLQKLQLTSQEGGLGAPDFKAYYYSGQLQWLSYWTAGRNLQEIGYTPADINRGELHTLLLPKAVNPRRSPPLLQTALRCWKKALTYTRRT